MQVLAPECSLSGSDTLLEACTAGISKFKTVEADSMEHSALSQELINGGWLTEHYQRYA